MRSPVETLIFDDVKLKALFSPSQAVMRAFLQQGGGGNKIVDVASEFFFHGEVRNAAYTASKIGMAGDARAAADE